eukprot:PhF_6_TR5226/c0_g1_i1/m.7546
MLRSLLDEQRKSFEEATHPSLYKPRRPSTAKIRTSNLDVTPNKSRIEMAYEAARLETTTHVALKGQVMEIHTSVRPAMNLNLGETVEKHERDVLRQHKEDLNGVAGLGRTYAEIHSRGEHHLTEFEMGYLYQPTPINPEVAEANELKKHDLKQDVHMVNDLVHLENLSLDELKHVVWELKMFELGTVSSLSARGLETIKSADRISHTELSIVFFGVHASLSKPVLEPIQSDLEATKDQVNGLFRIVEEENGAIEFGEKRKDYASMEQHMFARSQAGRDLLNLLHTRMQILRQAKDDVLTYTKERTDIVSDSLRVINQLEVDKSQIASNIETDVAKVNKAIADLKGHKKNLTEQHEKNVTSFHNDLRINGEDQQKLFTQINDLYEKVLAKGIERNEIVSQWLREKEQSSKLITETDSSIAILTEYLRKLNVAQEQTRVALQLRQIANEYIDGAYQFMAEHDLEAQHKQMLITEGNVHYTNYAEFIMGVGDLISKLEIRKDVLQRQERGYEFDLECARQTLDPQCDNYVQVLARVRQQKEETNVKIKILEELRESATEEFDITFNELSDLDPDPKREHPYIIWRASVAAKHEQVIVTTQKFVEKEQYEVELEINTIRKMINSASVQKEVDKTRPPSGRSATADRKLNEQRKE